MSNFIHSRLLRAALFTGLFLAIVSPAKAATGPFTLITSTTKTLSPAALTSVQQTITKGHISSDKKTLTFGQKIVRLVVVTGPDNDMLSYRIDGLRNPTLVVSRGATLKVLFVNTDDDMFHDLRFGNVQKVYGATMDSYLKISVGAPSLPHKSETSFHGDELTLSVPAKSGIYAYLCTVKGHAPGGMTGLVVVR